MKGSVRHLDTIGITNLTATGICFYSECHGSIILVIHIFWLFYQTHVANVMDGRETVSLQGFKKFSLM